MPTKDCHACGKMIDTRAEICPHYGVRQVVGEPSMHVDPEIRQARGKN